ncbi:DUF4349 domain-containing protein [Hymenobacter sp. DH14]|uniref:DUF4349 domain-containing protein n=1 Tax=Hymenobacter cyanobacteriorum TaxID=2926463 RepID=A0A9X2AEX3_9BACT|nr:DUF4349 domain-containing protein [Hymenobacter cyanobacteriorum]MCI1185858.1 DUF4349 domain-containing protein [Hymenobacter cyanobacteriorum]
MKYLIIPVLLGLGLAGCSQAKSDETFADAPPTAQAQHAPGTTAVASSTPVATPTAPEEQPTESVATAKAQPGHSVAYQAELRMAVNDFDKATDHVNELLERYGAYLGAAHETRADGQRRQEMKLQVPPRQFVALVSALGKLGHIEAKDIAAADITADALAAAAQFDAQQAAEAQTRQQLTKAGTPAERTRLEGEARRQRVETEVMKGQLQQFSNRANWASLTLRYYQVLPTTELTTPEPPVAPRFRQAFGWGWNLVMELAVGLVYAWPALLLAALGAWALHRWRLRQSLPA